jgi:hypothetical protein
MRGNPELLGLFCVAAVIIIPLALVLGAAILRAACWMCRVPEPGFLRAMGAVFLSGLLSGLANIALGFLVGLAAGVDHMSKEEALPFQLLVSLIGLLLSMLISASVYTAMLDQVDFAKGVLIWLAELLIKIIIGVVIAVVAVVLLVALGALPGGFR